MSDNSIPLVQERRGRGSRVHPMRACVLALWKPSQQGDCNGEEPALVVFAGLGLGDPRRSAARSRLKTRAKPPRECAPCATRACARTRPERLAFCKTVTFAIAECRALALAPPARRCGSEELRPVRMPRR